MSNFLTVKHVFDNKLSLETTWEERQRLGKCAISQYYAMKRRTPMKVKIHEDTPDGLKEFLVYAYTPKEWARMMWRCLSVLARMRNKTFPYFASLIDERIYNSAISEWDRDRLISYYENTACKKLGIFRRPRKRIKTRR